MLYIYKNAVSVNFHKESWQANQNSKEWGEKGSSTSAIAMSSITRSPALVRSDLTFSLHAAELPIETFLIVFHVPCQIKLQMDFGFPNHIPA